MGMCMMKGRTMVKLLCLSLLLLLMVQAAWAASTATPVPVVKVATSTNSTSKVVASAANTTGSVMNASNKDQAADTILNRSNGTVSNTPGTVVPSAPTGAKPAASPTVSTAPDANARGNVPITGPSGVIKHFTLYATDNYINRNSGALNPADPTSIPGWPQPVYIWGFTDVDPLLGNMMTVPPNTVSETSGADPTIAGSPVGNAQYPSPYIECFVGDDIYITLHNRGFYQRLQVVQDDHTIHLHGIHAQSQYDGFPESAGGYTEQSRYFWLEPWYLALGTTPKARDAAWNAMSGASQQALLNGNTPFVMPNALNAAGGVINMLNTDPYPAGVGGLTPAQVENVTQYTYYFRAQTAGTYMYHCHVAASEHVQQGMYGALIIRPADHSQTVYGAGTGTNYDKEYTALLSEIDPVWHANLETNAPVGFNPPDWKPQLWFTNGRAFPMTLFPHNDYINNTAQLYEPRYNTYVSVQPSQKFLIRYINMGYQPHAPHQHGWHFTIVGADAGLLPVPYNKYTLNIASGETYDTITTASPAYGADAPAGSPLAIVNSGRGSLNFRQVYPIHDHYDYQVTTNGIYPGGGAILVEVSGIPNAGTPTFADPYTGLVEPLPAPFPGA